MVGMKNPTDAQPSRGRRKLARPARPRKPRANAGNELAQGGLELPGWLPAEALPPNARHRHRVLYTEQRPQHLGKGIGLAHEAQIGRM